MTTNEKPRSLLTFTWIRLAVFCGISAAVIITWIFVPAVGFSKAANAQPGAFAVYFIDVGHGDCAVIQLPDGKVMVIDSGEETYYPRLATFLKKRLKTKTVDYVINSHPHADHCGGFARLLKNFKVGTVYRPIIKSNSPKETPAAVPAAEQISPHYDNFITAAYTHAASTELIVAGIVLDEGTGWTLTFHTPIEAQIPYLANGDLNEISAIITLDFGTTIFVFTGDAGFSTTALNAENGFLSFSPAALAIFGAGRAETLNTILKVGHHGSANSASQLFLDFIKPKSAVISVGKRYEGQLPNESLLARLNTANTQIYTTKDDGDIAFIQLDNTAQPVTVITGYDNKTSLAALYIIIFPAAFIGCFADIRRRN